MFYGEMTLMISYSSVRLVIIDSIVYKILIFPANKLTICSSNDEKCLLVGSCESPFLMKGFVKMHRKIAF